MRRVSLALALLGAVTAAGCSSGAKSSGTGTDPGISEGTFTVVVQNGQSINGAAANPALAIKGGYVTSTPAGIDCGIAPHTACSATFANDAAVTLTATVTDSKLVFWGWAGDCSGMTCSLSGAADKYVLAQIDTASAGQHSNYTDPAVHSAAYRAHQLDCRACHGIALQGAGIAVSCTGCHQPALAGTTTQTVEQCGTCHAGEGQAIHQNIYNTYVDATKLTATIDSVSSVPGTTLGTFNVTVLFTLKKSGVALTAADYTALGQKRLSLTRYTGTAGFETATAKTLTAATFVANGQFRSVTNGVKFDPKAATENGFFYFYFADKSVVPPGGHYFLPDNTVSVAQQFGTIPWTSTANVSACEACHGKEYAKHGYRQAKVAGLSDFVSCKACHTDQRGGVDFNLAMTYEDPARLAALEAQGAVCGGELCWSAEDEETYAYTATTMADTHISHAKEFLYPQSMANCATCHAGKLDRILTDANFTGKVCTTCHLIKGVNGADPKRAPMLTPAYHTIDWVKGVLLESDGATPPTITEMQCNECHNPTWVAPWDSTTKAPLFSQLHTGYNAKIYDSAGIKHSTKIAAQITSATLAGNVITFKFQLNGTGLAAPAFSPTVVVSLYGYDTKDFIVSGHGSAADGKRNLEWAPGSTSNGTRLTVTGPDAAGVWTAVADISSFTAKYNDAAGVNKFGTAIKRAELGVLPQVGADQTKAPDNAPLLADGATPNPNYNPYIAVTGVTKTFDLATGALVDDAAAYGRAIVDPAKCNKCHDALATEFHSPNYGSAGVVACRLCHVVGSGGSHLEMQSRSIDSYVHAIHAFQAMDIQNYNFADTVGAFEYDHHIGSTYPNFTTLSCESCHNPGTFEAPASDKSMPALLSASRALTGKTRAIGGVPTVVTGPASKACGGCHRAKFIKADDAAGLGAFDQHTGPDFGIRRTPGDATNLDTVIGNLKAGGVLQ